MVGVVVLSPKVARLESWGKACRHAALSPLKPLRVAPLVAGLARDLLRIDIIEKTYGVRNLLIIYHVTQLMSIVLSTEREHRGAECRLLACCTLQ